MAFVTVPPVLKDMLEAGGWNTERLLFDMYDINEAASEGHTPHAILMKKFPQLQLYWHNTSERYAKMNQKTVWSDTPIPPTRSHGYGFFSNFPGRKKGKAVFCPNDPAIDMDVLEGIYAAIPRPCSFYSAIMVWDAISWYPDSDLTPALRIIQPRHGQEDFNAGEWDGNHDFYECCIGYQSNCILLSYEFDTGPELEIRVELTDMHPMEEGLTVIEHFSQRLGKPVKQCVRAVFPWEISPPDKSVSGKTLAKRFVEHNGFARHNLCRWDDYGWCKRLLHGYWLHLDLSINPTARYASPVNMGLICYSVNFRIRYGCSLYQDFGMPRDTPADEAAFQVFQAALDRFQNEMVPRLAEVFGDTPDTFYQHSHILESSREFDV